MKVTWNEQEKCIQLDSKRYQKLIRQPRVVKDHIEFAVQVVGLARLNGNPKEVNKIYSDFIGGSVAQAYKVYNKLLYKYYYYTLDSKIRQIIWSPVKNKSLQRAVRLQTFQKDTLNTMNTVIADGITNVLPIVHYTKKSPHELKKYFGKGVWKSLCNNTFHRNRMLVQWGYILKWEHTPTLPDAKTISNVPTSLLMWYNPRIDIYIEDFNRLSKGHWTDYAWMEGFYDVFVDTKDMKLKLEEKWNPSRYSSFEELKKEHDAVTERFRIKEAKEREKRILEYSVEFEWLKDYPDELKLVDEDGNIFSAHLLRSKQKIHEEGDAMHHCVGSYADNVADGRYLVYSISMNGERYSTLGLEALYTHPSWRFSQHYKKRNQPVDQAGAEKLAKLVEHKVNSQGNF